MVTFAIVPLLFTWSWLLVELFDFLSERCLEGVDDDDGICHAANAGRLRFERDIADAEGLVHDEQVVALILPFSFFSALPEKMLKRQIFHQMRLCFSEK